MLYLEETGAEPSSPSEAPASELLAAEPPGTALLTAPDGQTVRVWRYPDDRALPALAALVFPDAARVVLDRLGITAPLRSVAIAAYRPGKRAVVRIVTDMHDLYVKVVPPGRLSDVLDRHRAWRAAGLPAPPVVASSRDGLVVLGALPGRPAADAIVDATAPAFADALDALRATLAATPTGHIARPSLSARVDWYATRAAALEPDAADEVRAIRAAVERLRDATPAATLETVHGDLHLGQLLTDPLDACRIIGVLDVDTSGTGDPADDDAALWAHLVVTAALGHAAAGALALEVRSRWARRGTAHRDRVIATSATLLLGHGLSGHLSMRTAIDLAARLIARPDENPLTPTSSASHTSAES